MSDTIDDRVDKVVGMLSGRTDLEANVQGWLWESYKEIASGYPFDTLEETEEDLFVPTIDEYDYPDNARAIKYLVGIRDNGGTYRVRKKDIGVVEQYSTTNTGRPAIFAPFGSVIIVRPVPNVSDTFRWRYWKKPVQGVTIEATELLLPEDWYEVVDYGAAMRGHMHLGEYEKASMVRTLLHGDPKHPEKPGLIKQKLLRREAENVISDFVTDPMIRPYT